MAAAGKNNLKLMMYNNVQTYTSIMLISIPKREHRIDLEMYLEFSAFVSKIKIISQTLTSLRAAFLINESFKIKNHKIWEMTK